MPGSPTLNGPACVHDTPVTVRSRPSSRSATTSWLAVAPSSNLLLLAEWCPLRLMALTRKQIFHALPRTLRAPWQAYVGQMVWLRTRLRPRCDRLVGARSLTSLAQIVFGALRWLIVCGPAEIGRPLHRYGTTTPRLCASNLASTFVYLLLLFKALLSCLHCGTSMRRVVRCFCEVLAHGRAGHAIVPEREWPCSSITVPLVRMYHWAFCRHTMSSQARC
ncbi:hypothetical protein C8Q80DRAFT_270397 [Daedaleopsis nitida]|nr:hypothetical protein C8Q80DRAFT_270397 [Daedaleopsis nitida]